MCLSPFPNFFVLPAGVSEVCFADMTNTRSEKGCEGGCFCTVSCGLSSMELILLPTHRMCGLRFA